MTDETLKQIPGTDETLEQFPSGKNDKVAEAINKLNENFSERMTRIESKIDGYKKESDAQFEAIRQGLVSNDARFDQLEALALEAKSIALVTRSQITILTEETKRNSIKTLV